MGATRHATRPMRAALSTLPCATRAALLAALCASLLGGCTDAREPTGPGAPGSLRPSMAAVAAATNGKIAFASTRDGSGTEIYVMNPDGSGQTRLTNNTAADERPAWSPDGTKLAFHSFRDGNWEVYVMNADGSGQTNLTNNAVLDADPAWSPDGTKLAFVSVRDGNDEIYVMNADGSGQIRLTNQPAFDAEPAWSPDGAKVAFRTDRDGSAEIYVMNADGSAQTRLTNNSVHDGGPAWSPDGTKLAFFSSQGRAGNSQIYVMNPDGSGQTNLSNFSEASEDQHPAWSPDGTKLAFQTFRGGSWEVYVMNADGAGQTRLTNNSAFDGEPAWQPLPAPAGIRFGVYYPWNGGLDPLNGIDGVPPASALAAEGISLTAVTGNVDGAVLASLDAIFIGVGGMVLGPEWTGIVDVDAVTAWLANGGTVIGEGHAVVCASDNSGKGNASSRLGMLIGLDIAPGAPYCQLAGFDTDPPGTPATITNPSHPLTAGLPASFYVNGTRRGPFLVLSQHLVGAPEKNPTAIVVGRFPTAPGEIVFSRSGRGCAIALPPALGESDPDWSLNADYQRLFVNAIKLCRSLNQSPGSTPAGAGVSVMPVDGTGQPSNAVSLSFGTVTAAGTTSVTTNSQGPTPPSGFGLGDPPVYYNITTTASFTGSITICINYWGTAFGDPSPLRLFHGDGAGGWADVTTSHDAASRTICGSVSSLSPFILAGPKLAQAITFTSTPPGLGVLGGVYQVAASGGGSGNPVVFSSLTSGVCAVAGSTVSLVAVGTCTVAADQAGNATYLPAPQATQSFSVVYAFTGFFQPVDNPPTVNGAKAGNAIPVKFSLAGDHGLDIFAAGYPVSRLMTCDSSQPIDNIEQTVTAGGSSLSYDANTDTYTYVWRTDKAWANSCRRLTVRLADGTDHWAHFRFTK